MYPDRGDVLRKFLPQTCTRHNGDLIDQFLAAWPVEVQLNVRTDIGEPIVDEEGRKKRIHEGIEFYDFRWPKKPGTEPDWTPKKMTYPLELFAAEIGSTGFSKAGSLWAGIDIDDLLGHAAGHGVSDAEIDRIDRALAGIAYVEVRRSTRGRGRHLRILLACIPTANHTEHAALARAALGKLCSDAGLDFSLSVDVCGGNLWFWSLRANEENRGFELLKAATQKLTEADLPNWRDHLDVVTRKHSKVRIEGLDEQEASSYPKVRKDTEHDRIFKSYQDHGYTLIYQPDHNLYQLHTGGLKKVHDCLELRGPFETETKDEDHGKQNAFAFLRPHGGLFVVCHGKTSEHPLWSKTASGKPCITFNLPIAPQAICRAVEAAWIGSGFTCATVAQAQKAAKLFGVKSFPAILSDRFVNFFIKGGGLIVEWDRKGKEMADGWGIKGRKFLRHFQIDLPAKEDSHHDIVRHLTTPTNQDAGWAQRRDDGTWGFEKKDTLKDSLISYGLDETDARAAVGKAARNPWTLVNEPFQPEFLSGRRWNRDGRKLIVPTLEGQLSHPHFDMIFEHCGKAFDEAVKSVKWCRQYGVLTGCDYLLLWAASLVQRPKHPLPYLFFWSPQNNTGKSAFHRSVGTLIEGGATDVHLALIENFNHQMAGAVLCFVEEKSLPPAAYAKLKSWVDSPTITIRSMHTNAYTFPNYAKFVQTANNRDACPIEPHDERIVVGHTPLLEEKIPWTEQMEPALVGEAPDFLAKLLAISLPPAAGRLFLPVLETQDKFEMMGVSGGSKGTIDRADVVRVLVDAVCKLIERVGRWQGYGGDLLKAIGSGPWTNSPGTLVGYLQDAVRILWDRGIEVSIPDTRVKGQREIVIAKGPIKSQSEPVDDAVRVVQPTNECSPVPAAGALGCAV